MRKLVVSLSLLSVLGLMMVASPQQADARPQYRKAFEAKYDIEDAKVKKCLVCHGKSKKMKSDYAMSLGKAIGKKNEKDMDVITKSLEKVEGMDSSVEGKTYGDLLKAGTLPAPYEEK